MAQTPPLNHFATSQMEILSHSSSSNFIVLIITCELENQEFSSRFQLVHFTDNTKTLNVELPSEIKPACEST